MAANSAISDQGRNVFDQNEQARKVLAVASGGGHWVELRRLYPAFESLDVAFVSVHPAYEEQVQGHRYYTVRDVTRWDRWGLIVLTAQLLRILLIERDRKSVV